MQQGRPSKDYNCLEIISTDPHEKEAAEATQNTYPHAPWTNRRRQTCKDTKWVWYEVTRVKHDQHQPIRKPAQECLSCNESRLHTAPCNALAICRSNAAPLFLELIDKIYSFISKGSNPTSIWNWSIQLRKRKKLGLGGGRPLLS